MNIKYNLVEGAKPELLIDMVSSPTTVYLRKDVEKIAKDLDGETIEIYQYKEAALSKEEYAIYLGEQAQANVEYVAMLSDIDLDV